MPTWYDGSLIRIEQESSSVRRFFVKHPDEQPLQFRAGQFITCDFPIGQKRHERWRSYSIASQPDLTSNEIELCIGHFPLGCASCYLFDQIKVGDVVRYKGPDGVFVLPENPKAHLVMVCTGTGVAPFRSMIRQIFSQEGPKPKVHLLFGTRTEADILYRAEFEALAKEQPNFQFDVALSRQPDWAGYRGYVHQIYQKLYDTPHEDIQFYLCGWKNMIDDAAEKLQLIGYSPKQITFELYG